jgi:hypothetical protein
MSSYRRILALVDLDQRGLIVAKQALKMAMLGNSSLCLAHIVDLGDEFPEGDLSLLAPSEMAGKLEIVRKLSRMAQKIGAEGAGEVVAFAKLEKGLATILRDWRPDMVFVDAEDLALAKRVRESCDVITVAPPVGGLLSMIVNFASDLLRHHRSAKSNSPSAHSIHRPKAFYAYGVVEELKR